MSSSYHLFTNAAPEHKVEVFLDTFEKDLKASTPNKYSASYICCSLVLLGTAALSAGGTYFAVQAEMHTPESDSKGSSMVLGGVCIIATASVALSALCCFIQRTCRQNRMDFEYRDDVLLHDLPRHVRNYANQFIRERGIQSDIFTIRDLRNYCIDHMSSENESLQIQIRT